MKKTYTKPVVVKKEQNRVHAGACGLTYSGGHCGKLVAST